MAQYADEEFICKALCRSLQNEMMPDETSWIGVRSRINCLDYTKRLDVYQLVCDLDGLPDFWYEHFKGQFARKSVADFSLRMNCHDRDEYESVTSSLSSNSTATSDLALRYHQLTIEMHGHFTVEIVLRHED